MPHRHHEHLRQRGVPHPARSEEHTSELQSRSDLVCRLLLEKKKNTAIGLPRRGGTPNCLGSIISPFPNVMPNTFDPPINVRCSSPTTANPNGRTHPFTSMLS